MRQTQPLEHWAHLCFADPEEVQATGARDTTAALVLHRQKSVIAEEASSPYGGPRSGTALTDTLQDAWLLPIKQSEWRSRQNKSRLLIKFDSDGRPRNPIGRKAWRHPNPRRRQSDRYPNPCRRHPNGLEPLARTARALCHPHTLQRRAARARVYLTEWVLIPLVTGTGLRGRGSLGAWGPNFATDLLVTRWKPNVNGIIEVLTMKRNDGSYGLLGAVLRETDSRLPKERLKQVVMLLMGGEEDDESSTKLREKLDLPRDQSSTQATHPTMYWHLIHSGYVDDHRATDNAWLESVSRAGSKPTRLCLHKLEPRPPYHHTLAFSPILGRRSVLKLIFAKGWLSVRMPLLTGGLPPALGEEEAEAALR